MTLEEIKNECMELQAILETIIPSDINGVVEHAKMLAVYLARSGYLLAEAKKIARSARTKQIGETIIKIAKEQYLSAKAQNAIVDSIATEEMFLVDHLDRINSGLVHTMDLCRTIVSKEKAELQYLGYHAT